MGGLCGLPWLTWGWTTLKLQTRSIIRTSQKLGGSFQHVQNTFGDNSAVKALSLFWLFACIYKMLSEYWKLANGAIVLILGGCSILLVVRTVNSRYLSFYDNYGNQIFIPCLVLSLTLSHHTLSCRNRNTCHILDYVMLYNMQWKHLTCEGFKEDMCCLGV